MGKGTELDKRLRARPLTAAEIAAKRSIAEMRDGDLVATLDGEFVKRTPQTAPRVVRQAPRQTWD